MSWRVTRNDEHKALELESARMCDMAAVKEHCTAVHKHGQADQACCTQCTWIVLPLCPTLIALM